jgi:hypothetical protein
MSVQLVDFAEGLGVLVISLGNLDTILQSEDWRFELRLGREDVVFGLAHVFEFVDVVLREDNLLTAARAEITGHDAKVC